MLDFLFLFVSFLLICVFLSEIDESILFVVISVLFIIFMFFLTPLTVAYIATTINRAMCKQNNAFVVKDRQIDCPEMNSNFTFLVISAINDHLFTPRRKAARYIQ